jgi:protein CrcB
MALMAVALLSVRRRWLAVFYGGFVGTLARYLLSLIIQGWWGKSWPSDILLINLTGAFLLALITTLADGTFLVGPTRRLLLNTGCMGAYTTFSWLGQRMIARFRRTTSGLLPTRGGEHVDIQDDLLLPDQTNVQ